MLEEAARRGLLGGDVEVHLAHSSAFATALSVAATGVVEVGSDETDQERSSNGMVDGVARPGERDDSSHSVADIGTGAGVPGLVVAAEVSDLRVTLIERRQGRLTWLEEACRSVETAARTLCDARLADVYDLAHGSERESFDLVTARAFGPPRVTAELGGGLVRLGGVLVVSEPPEQQDRWDPQTLAPLGLRVAEALVVDGFHFQLLDRVEHLSDRYPRRRIPEKS